MTKFDVIIDKMAGLVRGLQRLARSIYLLLNAIPLGTCEKAKACECRVSETCNWNVEEKKNPRASGDLIPCNM